MIKSSHLGEEGWRLSRTASQSWRQLRLQRAGWESADDGTSGAGVSGGLGDLYKGGRNAGRERLSDQTGWGHRGAARARRGGQMAQGILHRERDTEWPRKKGRIQLRTRGLGLYQCVTRLLRIKFLKKVHLESHRRYLGCVMRAEERN